MQFANLLSSRLYDLRPHQVLKGNYLELINPQERNLGRGESCAQQRLVQRTRAPSRWHYSRADAAGVTAAGELGEGKGPGSSPGTAIWTPANDDRKGKPLAAADRLKHKAT